MNLNTYNICDDWGWFVDTDNNLLINSTIIELNVPNRKYKMMNYHYNRLYPIEEDEYDYVKNNYKDIENLEMNSSYKKIERKHEKIVEKIQEKNSSIVKTYLYRIGSTTIITALLTYAIFFLI